MSNWFSTCITKFNIITIHLVKDLEGDDTSISDWKDKFMGECDVIGRGVLHSIKE